jgi:hypothetical protein
MFFLEQGALDYITRLEAQATPEAAARNDATLQKCDVEHVASSGGHEHTHLNLLDAAQAAHTHTHLCGGGGGSGGGNRTPAQQMALCVSLELSIVVHSVIIGCACSAAVAVPNKSLTAAGCPFSPLLARSQLRAGPESGQLHAGGPRRRALLPPVLRGPWLRLLHRPYGRVSRNNNMRLIGSRTSDVLLVVRARRR